MQKRIIAIILSFILIFSAFGCVSADQNGANPFVLRYYASITESEMMSADVLELTLSDLSNGSDEIRNYVDQGGVLYIVAPEEGCEKVADMLGIKLDQTYTYPRALLIAYSVYKIDKAYVVGQHYVHFIDEVEEESKSSVNFDNCITVEKYGLYHPEFSYEKFINYDAVYLSYLDDLDFYSSGHNLLYSTGISGTAKFTNTMNVYNSSGVYYGFLRGTIYVSEYGYGYVNNTYGYLYNLVASVKAYPNTGYYVNTYSCSVNANITGHTILDTATLPSGVSTSSSLSISGNISSASYGAGAAFTTSWTYNPESQIITESSTNPKIINWTAQTVSPISGKAYDVTPNSSIFVSPGYSGQRGAFITIRCPALTFLGIVNNENSLEIGGWF